MTRINVVPPQELSRQHLLAEYRELPRVFGLVRKAQGRGATPADFTIPTDYTLGRGHVTFFYNKLLWLSWRHIHLVNEMVSRGYEPKFTANLRVEFGDLDYRWFGDWQPDAEALRINRARIKERTK